STNPLNSTLDGIHGPLIINGQYGSTDVLNVNDQGATTGHSYYLGGNTLNRSGAAAITYNGVDAVNGAAGNGAPTFTLASAVPAGTKLALDGTTGVNTLWGPNLTNNWVLTGPGTGNLNGVNFSGVQNLNGGSQQDTFWFWGKTAAVSGTIDGGLDD